MSYFQIFILALGGIAFLWFGYSIFFGPKSPFYPGNNPNKREEKGRPGDPQVCPVCSTRLTKGELVKTQAFPAANNSKDRLMHIRGCSICLNTDVLRRCPVCGIELELDDFLISRMFERRTSKNHIHVLGCNHCRKVKKPAEKEA